MGKEPTPRRTQKVTHSFEREMARMGMKQFDFMSTVYKKNLLPEIVRLKFPGRLRTGYFDSAEDERTIKLLKDLVQQLTDNGTTNFSNTVLQPGLASLLKRLDVNALEQIARTTGRQPVGAVFNSGINDVIERTVGDTVQNFKISGQRTADTIKDRIASGIVAGERHESIAKAIKSSIGLQGDERGKANSRARFIARNTVAKTLGEINKERQTAIGIELYQWQTAEDERVRPTHQDLNSKIFSWDGTVKVNGQTYKQASDPDFNGGAPTIPGQPWNCRCVALAYIPELDGE